MATIPNENDVLFGRSPAITAHPGNRRFRTIVDAQKKNFALETERRKKRTIAANIINAIHCLQPKGRFLTEDQSSRHSQGQQKIKGGLDGAGGGNVHPILRNKVWVCVPLEKALTKILQRLREKETTEVRNDPTLNSGTRQRSSGTDESSNVSSAIGEPNHCPPLTDSMKEIPDSKSLHRCDSNDPLSDGSGVIDHNSALEGSIPDEDVHAFLSDFSAQHDHGEVLGLRELTLKEWIHRTRPKRESGVPEYIRSALPIALKLTECLVEAEKEGQNGHGNPIPLASIAAEHVSLQAREVSVLTEVSAGDQVREVIENVWITRFVGEGLQPTSRLVALGIVLYELFSAGPLLPEDMPTMDATSNMLSINSINLTNESNIADRPSKRSQRHASVPKDKIFYCIASLESQGAPSSICDLIGNLLDCANGDFSGEDAYASLADLQSDLQLMRNDPARFLDNIAASRVQPTFMCGKLYGREDEMTRLKQYYVRRSNVKCSGAIIQGGAGVGKSALARHVQELTHQAEGSFTHLSASRQGQRPTPEGSFSVAKFDQNKDAVPLSTIGALFNSICDVFVRDATPTQLLLVEATLTEALANQAALLASVVPSLTKLMPSCFAKDASSRCVDLAASMRYLFGKLLTTLSSHSRSISIAIDDVHWGDSASLLLILALISDAASFSSVFFIFSYRDDDVSISEHFETWLKAMSMLSHDWIVLKLKEMSPDSVNDLMSEALHLCPRITRPLASVLHHKTRGNALFLRQLIMQLREHGDIYVDVRRPRWSWDLNKIMDMEISDDVLALLIKEMQSLPIDLQLGLQVASCWGSCVKYSIVDILSEELKIDCHDLLQQVSKRSFMTNLSDAAMFRFAHDKIEQAAYELMGEQQRRGYHMRFALALFAIDVGNTRNDELFFAAVNQMNSGGPNIVNKSDNKIMFAGLNLEAGRRAVGLSDNRAALKLFQHGISFLDGGHWTTNYKLSLGLFSEAAEAASVINIRDAAITFSDQVVAHAKSYEDKINSLCSAAKVLLNAGRIEESMERTFLMLMQVGEQLPRPSGDNKLNHDIEVMNGILQNTPDEGILNMKDANEKTGTVLKLYSSLLVALHYHNSSLNEAVCLRMVDLTLTYGLSTTSPLAFACYGGVLTNIGEITAGCRLGRLALNLLQKGDCIIHTAHIIFQVYYTTLWTADPLQSVSDSHLLGMSSGKLAGDYLFSNLNWYLSAVVSYTAGSDLDTVRRNIGGFIKELQRVNTLHLAPMRVFVLMLHSLVVALKEGLHVLDLDLIDNIPTESVLPVRTQESQKQKIRVGPTITSLVRAFLFRQLDDILLHVDIANCIAKNQDQLCPHYLFGMYFEGLASFYLARAKAHETAKWIAKGESVLARMRDLNEHSSWNWSSKVLLLEAERMHASNVDGAANVYERAIQSAREHKFVHEEAIASELAGMFHCDSGLCQKSLRLLLHSVRKYKEWGALAIAMRVEGFIESRYGPDITQWGIGNDVFEYIHTNGRGLSKKRQDIGS